MKVEQMNGLMLAFVGDAYYDLMVKERLIRRGVNKSNAFHRQTVFYVSAKAQSEVLQRMLAADFLTEDEQDVVRRGRNAKSKSIPKHTEMIDYRLSTAFEALIGYLYLTENKARLDAVVDQAMALREEETGDGKQQ